MNAPYHDVRFALRALRRAPVFTAVVVLTLGLGIGANTAIFSIANGILWRPLPVREPDRLTLIAARNRAQGGYSDFSYPDYEDFRRDASGFEDIIAYVPTALSFSHREGSERIWAEVVSPNFFSALGVQPTLGRGFDPGDAAGAAPTVVVSDRFRRRLALDQSPLLGWTLRLNGHDFTIVGAAPPEFHGVYQVLFAPDVWLPVSSYDLAFPGTPGRLHRRGATTFRLMGRLRPDITLTQANASVAAIGRRLEVDYPATNAGFDAEAIPELAARPEPGAARGFAVAAGGFLVVVGLVLLIACANVANLLLVRATVRRKEIALRLALGAGRRHLLSQLLTESLLLGLVGGLIGYVIAVGATSLLGAEIRFPTDIPFLFDFSPDRRVLGFTLGISLLTGLVFGLAPALQASGPDMLGALKNEPVLGRGGRWLDLRGALVVAQVAVSCILLVGTGLMFETLAQLKRLDPGFESRGGMVVSLSPALLGYDQKQGEAFYRRVLEEVDRLPGVRGASLAQNVPLEFSASGGAVFVPGQESKPGHESGDPMLWSAVSADYLGVMGTPLLEGRDLTARDDSVAPRVAVINHTMAEQYWPGTSPVGRTIRLNTLDGPPVEIVGVMADGKYRNLEERPLPYLLLPLLQNYTGNVTLVVRGADDLLEQLPAVRRAIHAVDPEMPIFDPKSLDQLIEGRALLGPRLGAGLAGVFGILALGLAMIGLYGVISYPVTQRTREMGIRIALGAPLQAVGRMVLRDGLRLAGLGVVLGTAGALGLTLIFRSLFFGVNPTDPRLLLPVPLLLIVVALLASYLPARRATRVDPIIALRSE